jgi:hypothetical protein
LSGPTGSVSCFALDAGAPPPTSLLLNQQLRGCDFGAVLQNAQEQVTVMARAGEVGKALQQSTTKLQSLWKLGSASAGAMGAFDQLHGGLGDLVKQGGDLAKQIQAAGKILQSVLQILKFTQAANAAVAALLPNPFTHAAGRALAAVSKAQIVVQLGTIAQMAASIGTVMSAIQQATHKTNSTTAELGSVLNAGTGTGAMPPAATPTFPTHQPAVMPPNPAYPTYPTVTASQPAPGIQVPAVMPPRLYPQYPSTPGYPSTSGYPSQTGMPTVYQSGWVPQGGAQGRTGTGGQAGGAAGGLTIDITDSDHDGRYEVKVNVPESQLNKDIKIDIDAKVGDQVVKGSFDIDV